jgi:hypothetical protein
MTMSQEVRCHLSFLLSSVADDNEPKGPSSFLGFFLSCKRS